MPRDVRDRIGGRTVVHLCGAPSPTLITTRRRTALRIPAR
jgi:hypothetical protein